MRSATGLGLMLAIPAGIVAFFLAPDSTTAFYSAAAQVNPVFLVALAIERSLSESLGTESQYLREARARVETDYEPPERDAAILSAVRAVLLRHSEEAGALYPGDDEWIFRRTHLDAVEPMTRLGQADQWDSFTEAVDAEMQHKQIGDLGEWANTQGARSSGVLTLAVMAYATQAHPEIVAPVTGPTDQFRVKGRDVLTMADRLYDASVARDREEQQDAAARYAVTRYRRIKRHQRTSLLFSISVLALGETLAFIGLASPGGRYPALFAASTGCLVASGVVVTAGALRELLDEQ